MNKKRIDMNPEDHYFDEIDQVITTAVHGYQNDASSHSTPSNNTRSTTSRARPSSGQAYLHHIHDHTHSTSQINPIHTRMSQDDFKHAPNYSTGIPTIHSPISNLSPQSSPPLAQIPPHLSQFSSPTHTDAVTTTKPRPLTSHRRTHTITSQSGEVYTSTVEVSPPKQFQPSGKKPSPTLQQIPHSNTPNVPLSSLPSHVGTVSPPRSNREPFFANTPQHTPQHAPQHTASLSTILNQQHTIGQQYSRPFQSIQYSHPYHQRPPAAPEHHLFYIDDNRSQQSLEVEKRRNRLHQQRVQLLITAAASNDIETLQLLLNDFRQQKTKMEQINRRQRQENRKQIRATRDENLSMNENNSQCGLITEEFDDNVSSKHAKSATRQLDITKLNTHIALSTTSSHKTNKTVSSSHPMLFDKTKTDQDILHRNNNHHNNNNNTNPNTNPNQSLLSHHIDDSFLPSTHSQHLHNIDDSSTLSSIASMAGEDEIVGFGMADLISPPDNNTYKRNNRSQTHQSNISHPRLHNRIRLTQPLQQPEIFNLANAHDYDRRYGLHLAASEGHLLASQLLIEYGHDVNVIDRFGHTPFDDALKNGYYSICDYLISHGGHIGDNLAENIEIFHNAMLRKDYIIMELMLRAQFSPNFISPSTGNSPVHYALEQNDVGLVRLLLTYRANMYFDSSNTPTSQNAFYPTLNNCTKWNDMSRNNANISSHYQTSTVGIHSNAHPLLLAELNASKHKPQSEEILTLLQQHGYLRFPYTSPTATHASMDWQIHLWISTIFESFMNVQCSSFLAFIFAPISFSIKFVLTSRLVQHFFLPVMKFILFNILFALWNKISSMAILRELYYKCKMHQLWYYVTPLTIFSVWLQLLIISGYCLLLTPPSPPSSTFLPDIITGFNSPHTNSAFFDPVMMSMSDSSPDSHVDRSTLNDEHHVQLQQDYDAVHFFNLATKMQHSVKHPSTSLLHPLNIPIRNNPKLYENFLPFSTFITKEEEEFVDRGDIHGDIHGDILSSNPQTLPKFPTPMSYIATTSMPHFNYVPTIRVYIPTEYLHYIEQEWSNIWEILASQRKVNSYHFDSEPDNNNHRKDINKARWSYDGPLDVMSISDMVDLSDGHNSTQHQDSKPAHKLKTLPVVSTTSIHPYEYNFLNQQSMIYEFLLQGGEFYRKFAKWSGQNSNNNPKKTNFSRFEKQFDLHGQELYNYLDLYAFHPSFLTHFVTQSLPLSHFDPSLLHFNQFTYFNGVNSPIRRHQVQNEIEQHQTQLLPQFRQSKSAYHTQSRNLSSNYIFPPFSFPTFPSSYFLSLSFIPLFLLALFPSLRNHFMHLILPVALGLQVFLLFYAIYYNFIIAILTAIGPVFHQILSYFRFHFITTLLSQKLGALTLLTNIHHLSTHFFGPLSSSFASSRAFSQLYKLSNLTHHRSSELGGNGMEITDVVATMVSSGVGTIEKVTNIAQNDVPSSINGSGTGLGAFITTHAASPSFLSFVNTPRRFISSLLAPLSVPLTSLLFIHAGLYVASLLVALAPYLKYCTTFQLILLVLVHCGGYSLLMALYTTFTLSTQLFSLLYFLYTVLFSIFQLYTLYNFPFPTPPPGLKKNRASYRSNQPQPLQNPFTERVTPQGPQQVSTHQASDVTLPTYQNILNDTGSYQNGSILDDHDNTGGSIGVSEEDSAGSDEDEIGNKKTVTTLVRDFLTKLKVSKKHPLQQSQYDSHSERKHLILDQPQHDLALSELDGTNGTSQRPTSVAASIDSNQSVISSYTYNSNISHFSRQSLKEQTSQLNSHELERSRGEPYRLYLLNSVPDSLALVATLVLWALFPALIQYFAPSIGGQFNAHGYSSSPTISLFSHPVSNTNPITSHVANIAHWWSSRNSTSQDHFSLRYIFITVFFLASSLVGSFVAAHVFRHEAWSFKHLHLVTLTGGIFLSVLIPVFPTTLSPSSSLLMGLLHGVSAIYTFLNSRTIFSHIFLGQNSKSQPFSRALLRAITQQQQSSSYYADQLPKSRDSRDGDPYSFSNSAIQSSNDRNRNDNCSHFQDMNIDNHPNKMKSNNGNNENNNNNNNNNNTNNNNNSQDMSSTPVSVDGTSFHHPLPAPPTVPAPTAQLRRQTRNKKTSPRLLLTPIYVDKASLTLVTSVIGTSVILGVVLRCLYRLFQVSLSFFVYLSHGLNQDNQHTVSMTTPLSIIVVVASSLLNFLGFDSKQTLDELKGIFFVQVCLFLTEILLILIIGLISYLAGYLAGVLLLSPQDFLQHYSLRYVYFLHSYNLEQQRLIQLHQQQSQAAAALSPSNKIIVPLPLQSSPPPFLLTPFASIMLPILTATQANPHSFKTNSAIGGAVPGDEDVNPNIDFINHGNSIGFGNSFPNPNLNRYESAKGANRKQFKPVFPQHKKNYQI